MKIQSLSDIESEGSNKKLNTVKKGQTTTKKHEITAIKQQIKQDNRVSIFVDGKYTFSLTLDQLLETKLKKGIQLTPAKIKKMQALSDEGKLKQRALEWLMLRPHSEREFRDYLYKKKADKDLIDAWLVEFRDKKYLDDEAFARWFSDNRLRKHKSQRAVVAELMSKGVSKSVIDVILHDMQSTDASAIDALIIKLQNKSRYQDPQKLMAYLAGKGFSYPDIRDAMARAEES